MEKQKETKTATKSRILFLLRYLFENTDDEHAVSTNDLIAILAENSFSANRKTVRDDVEMLCESGYEIFVDKDGKSNAYHFGSRTFELPELKMLVDDSFTAVVQVQPSNTFYAWVFTFCGDIEILEPEHVRDEYRRMARRAAGIEQGNAICK